MCSCFFLPRSSGAPGLCFFSFFSFYSYLSRRPCVSVHLEGRIIFVLISVRLGVPMAAAILPAGPACTFFEKSRGYVLRDFCDFVIYCYFLSIFCLLMRLKLEVVNMGGVKRDSQRS